MRGEQMARQWRLLKQLEVSGIGLTAKEISENGEVSLRTAYRDLEDLQNSGFPLYVENTESGKRWKLIDTFKSKIPPPFTLTELLSLYLGLDLLRLLKGTVFAESVESLSKKVRAALSPQALAYIDRLQSTFRTGIRPYKDYGKFRELIQQTNRAAMERRRIEIVYHALHSDEETLRKIDPYRIWFFDGTLYIIGLCHLRSQIRTFVLDRIKMLHLTDETFEVPEDFDLDKLMKHSFKVMKDELYTVRVRISPAWSRYVGERIWHESQRIQKQVDGSIEITFHVAGLDEIRQWILSFGPEACAVEPPELVAAVAKSHQQALEQYNGLEFPSVDIQKEESKQEDRLWEDLLPLIFGKK